MKKIAIVFLTSLLSTAVLAQTNDTLQKGTKAKVLNGMRMATDKTLIQNFSRLKDYSEFLSAIFCADLKETFESKGPITIFAPTNEAFEKMPQGMLDTLQKPEHKFELSSLITYHAIPGRITVRDIVRTIREHKGTATFITLAGSKLYASIDANRNVVLTDESGGHSVISTFDVVQRNGILHVVTSVLIPKARAI